MMNPNGVPQIPWPETLVYKSDPEINSELVRVTSLGYALKTEGRMGELDIMATTNGLIGEESQQVLRNAAIVAMMGLKRQSIARLKPEHIEPLINASLSATNAVALKHPLEVLPSKLRTGIIQVGSIGEARSRVYQARTQDDSPIQIAPSVVRTSGLDGQEFQPFAFLFIGKEDGQVAYVDKLLRYQNPFGTTVMRAVSESLQTVLGNKKSSTDKPKRWSLLGTLTGKSN